MILGAKVLLTLFVFFAWWLGGVIEKTVSTVGSIPSSFWLWTLGIVATIVVIAILAKSKSAREYGRKHIKLKWILWPAVIVGFFVLANSYKDEAGREVKDYLRDKDIGGLPILARNDPVSPEAALAIIAECESGGRHLDKDNNVVTNENSNGTLDHGKWQINSIHEERAKSMGHLIRTEEGNEAFAKVLFDESGTEPWEASRGCWEDKISAPYAKTFSGTTVATRFIHARRDWSEWVRVPAGQELFFERTNPNVAFEIELQSGETFEFPPNFRGHERFSLIQRIRFRVTDKEAEELSIWLRFSPFS